MKSEGVESEETVKLRHTVEIKKSEKHTKTVLFFVHGY
jgi:hypothetical protein